MTDFTSIFRRTTYPAISPTEPTRSQQGRTVLIVGGSSGIGFNIARAFAEAKAERIILVARGRQQLEQAIRTLSNDFPETCSLLFQCDLADEAHIRELWVELTLKNITIDVLVLNAGPPNPSNEDLNAAISSFQFGIISNLRMLNAFRNQTFSSTQQKFLINITTAAIHCYPFPSSIASTAANAGFVSYLGHLADHIAETELRIVSVHPGCVFTERSFRASGQSKEAAIWDDPVLSAHMAVWTTDEGCAFLHGRFIWANWDVEELMDMKERIVGDAGLLKVGVNGVCTFDLSQLFAKCSEIRQGSSEGK